MKKIQNNFSIKIKKIVEKSFNYDFEKIDLENFDYSNISIRAGMHCEEEPDKNYFYSLGIIFDYYTGETEIEGFLKFEVLFNFEKNSINKKLKNKTSDYIIVETEKEFISEDSEETENMDSEEYYNKNLAKVFFSIAYGCMRGMLISKNYNMPINVILPVIDFDKVIKKFED